MRSRGVLILNIYSLNWVEIAHAVINSCKETMVVGA